DAKNGEELIGASVVIESLSTGVLTNAYGYYSLNVVPGLYKVIFSYVGYTTTVKTVDLTKGNVKLNIELAEEKKQLDAVVVSSDKPSAVNVQQNKMSVVKMEMKEVKKIPLLMGEVDIIKAVQMMPG